MKKKELVYRCGNCGHEEPKWLGRCPECGEWNTLTETAVNQIRSPSFSGKGSTPRSFPLASLDPQESSRIGSGIPEFDRILGGGIMKRSAVLVGGEPGIGKSTLLLQVAALADTKGRVLYISGEESAGQIRMRSDRLGLFGTTSKSPEQIEILCSGKLEDINIVLESVKPVIIIIDSAQTLYSTEAGTVPGTVNQMKFCSYELISWVKEHDAALFLLAHVTKDGLISGPKSLEHMVDTVLYFEQNDTECRFLRAAKNRFGSVDEIGIFIMTEKGLGTVEDTSLLFLVRREGELPPGVATAAVLEGSRSFLVEIQALTVPAKGGLTRVYSDRIDSARVSRVAAALEKYLSLRLSDQDIYVNVAGGIRITDVGAELALAFALYSARTGLSLPSGIAIAGELSLTGEIRPVRRPAGRVRSARGMGFNGFLGPRVDDSGRQQKEEGGADISSAQILRAGNIKEAVKLLFGLSSSKQARQDH
ncbi:MAG: DNA repair protein RadA [Treponema sp.]|nr:DNA repair protein RadA [Treponema sp.]